MKKESPRPVGDCGAERWGFRSDGPRTPCAGLTDGGVEKYLFRYTKGNVRRTEMVGEGGDGVVLTWIDYSCVSGRQSRYLHWELRMDVFHVPCDVCLCSLPNLTYLVRSGRAIPRWV